jgi:hypothetical protein
MGWAKIVGRCRGPNAEKFMVRMTAIIARYISSITQK